MLVTVLAIPHVVARVCVQTRAPPIRRRSGLKPRRERAMQRRTFGAIQQRSMSSSTSSATRSPRSTAGARRTIRFKVPIAGLPNASDTPRKPGCFQRPRNGLCGGRDSNPHGSRPRGPRPRASTSSATPAPSAARVSSATYGDEILRSRRHGRGRGVRIEQPIPAKATSRSLAQSSCCCCSSGSR